MNKFYQNPKNEEAFRKWVEERREREREAGITNNLCNGVLPWEVVD